MGWPQPKELVDVSTAIKGSQKPGLVVMEGSPDLVIKSKESMNAPLIWVKSQDNKRNPLAGSSIPGDPRLFLKGRPEDVDNFYLQGVSVGSWQSIDWDKINSEGLSWNDQIDISKYGKP